MKRVLDPEERLNALCWFLNLRAVAQGYAPSRLCRRSTVLDAEWWGGCWTVERVVVLLGWCDSSGGVVRDAWELQSQCMFEAHPALEKHCWSIWDPGSTLWRVGGDLPAQQRGCKWMRESGGAP